jgi:hypothetical protein
MNRDYQLITIVSRLGDELQAWTFDIDERDLNNLMLKYDCCGVSVLGDADDIGGEIKEIYNG